MGLRPFAAMGRSYAAAVLLWEGTVPPIPDLPIKQDVNKKRLHNQTINIII